MSNGSLQAGSDAAERPASFFDKTENNYRNMEQRGRECRERIDNFCDAIGGGQPREAISKGLDTDRASAAFDRCNAAETAMYGSMSSLEDTITRLETLGLT